MVFSLFPSSRLSRATRVLLGAVAVCGLAGLSHPAAAQTVTTTKTSTWVTNTTGQDTAQAVFSIASGSTTYLDITLTNTSTFSQNWSTNDVLTGLVFNATIAGSDVPVTTSTPAFATTPNQIMNWNGCSSSAYTTCEQPPVNLGAEYALRYSASGFSSAPITGSPHFGIVLTQYSAFANTTTAENPLSSSATALQTSANLASTVDFGLVGTNYGNGLGSTPLAVTSISFGFALPNGTTSLNLSNVGFLYGVSATSSINGVPEPSSLLLIAPVLIGCAMLRSHHRKTRGMIRSGA